jgi:hypothetical protein
MRDIRQDLLERIAAETARKEPLLRAISAIDANLETLNRLLSLEEQRNVVSAAGTITGSAIVNGVTATAISSNRNHVMLLTKPTLPLLGFVMEKLLDGPLHRGELAKEAEAAGYFVGLPNVSPGRMVHGALLNAFRAGEVTRTGDGFYSLTGKGKDRVTAAQRLTLALTQ